MGASIETVRNVYHGASGGWCVAGVTDWLVREGRMIKPTAAMIDGLVDQLDAAGAPIDRLRLTFRTINPQIFGHTYMWVRGGKAQELNVGHHIQQSDDYIGSPIETLNKTGRTVRHRLTGLTPGDHSVLHNMAAMGLVDYVVLPVRFTDGHIGAFTLATKSPAGFTDDDIEKFEVLARHLSPITEAIAMHSVARSLLDTYVGRRTGTRVLNGAIKRGDGEAIDAVVWFSDLRDFTPLTETLPPDRMLAMLNAYFETVDSAVSSYGGEILRFIGDAMLIVFPTNEYPSVAAACRAAVDAAVDAFNSMAAVNHRRRRAGEPEIRFGVGLHVGHVVYGNVGGQDRLDFTVMGPAVNRAARLEGLTKTLGHALLVSGDMAEHVGCATVDLGRHAMKGVAEPQPVFALPDLTVQCAAYHEAAAQ
jgi:adenylate cyclase